MKTMCILLSSLFILGACISASAADIYYASASAGSNNGTSCVNAYAYNDGTNGWNTATAQTAGNTLHICGTFTFALNATPLAIAHSGTMGNPITFQFETNAIMQSPAFGLGAITCASSSWIVIDGGTNGIIQNTANGTSKANHSSSSEGIRVETATPCHNSIVRNLHVLTIYVHDQNSSDGNVSSSAAVNAIDWSGNNNRITNNVTSDAQSGISTGGPGASGTFSGMEIDHNTVTNANRSITASVGASGEVLSGLLIHDNTICQGNYLWDEPANAFHHNGVHAFNIASGSISGLQLYNNSCTNVTGGNDGQDHWTGYYFLETLNGSSSTLIYNNLFQAGPNSPEDFTNNGYVFCKAGGTGAGNDCQIYNNVFVGVNNGSHNGTAIACASPQTMIIKNNVCEFSTCIGGGGCTWTADYNDYYLTDLWNGGTWASWQLAGQDAHSFQSTDPGLTSYVPTTMSAVYHAGTNLTSLGITALDTSLNSISRSAVSAWTMGANDATGGSCTPSKVVYTAQPSNAEVGSTLGTVSVSVEDSGGNVCTSDTSTVTLSSHAGSTAATLQSNSSLSKAATAGVATWTDLFVSPTTGTISIDAADGALTGATSSTITISCTPSKVVFTSQPGNTTIGSNLGTVTVAVQNSSSITCSADMSSVTIANKAATCTGMSLSGTATGNNIFSTSNLTENAAGACTLHATDGALTAADSSAFTISATAGGSTRGRMHRP